MYGGTKINILNTTVKREFIKHAVIVLHLHPEWGAEGACANVVDGAKPGTIGGMLREYYLGLDESTFEQMLRTIVRKARENEINPKTYQMDRKAYEKAIGKGVSAYRFGGIK